MQNISQVWLQLSFEFIELRDQSVGPETFAKDLEPHVFRVGFSDVARTFEFV